MAADRNTFYSIYEKYKYLMFSIAMDILQDKFSAEDAVQEAFVKILDNYNKIDNLDSDRTKRLIITITKNTAIDIYRKRKKQWNSEIGIDKIVSFEQSGFYTTEETDQFPAIEGLPDMYKEVLLLKFSAGFSNAEIADILETSEANVRKRISRARKLLKQNMKERG